MIQITSFKDPYHPSVLAERFPAGVFAVNARRNWEIVFALPADGWTGKAAATMSAAEDPRSMVDRHEVWQMLHVEVFWKPRPGTTFAESSQTNANISYYLLMGGRMVAYEGAGFVYFDASPAGDRIRGRIESGTLAPRRQDAESADALGRCRLVGEFEARRNEGAVVAAQLEIRRRSSSKPFNRPTSPEADHVQERRFDAAAGRG